MHVSADLRPALEQEHSALLARQAELDAEIEATSSAAARLRAMVQAAEILLRPLPASMRPAPLPCGPDLTLRRALYRALKAGPAPIAEIRRRLLDAGWTADALEPRVGAFAALVMRLADEDGPGLYRYPARMERAR